MSTSLDWDLEAFAKFWENIEYAEAMQLKRVYVYGEPCDCGSSVCDECNPGWDQEGPFDWEDKFAEDYY